MCRRFKMGQKLFLRVKIVMYLSPLFGGSHFFGILKSALMSLCVCTFVLYNTNVQFCMCEYIRTYVYIHIYICCHLHVHAQYVHATRVCLYYRCFIQSVLLVFPSDQLGCLVHSVYI